MDTVVDWDSFFQFVDPNTVSPIVLTQEPTPPQSDEDSPPIPDRYPSLAGESSNELVLNISSTFLPGANLNSLDPDLILLSMDQVFFYVHSHLLLDSSINNFGSLLPVTPSHISDNAAYSHPSTPNPATTRGIDWAIGQHYPVLRLPHHSTVLNIILHAVYDLSSIHYSPPIDTLIKAIEEMPNLGLPLKSHISPGTSLYTQLISLAPLHPLQLYALSGHHDLHELAVPVSSYLLSYPLSQIEDSIAKRIGATYLKRLFFLHNGRMEALKRMLLQPPHPHAPTPYCDFNEQRKLTRAWALASASLAWDAKPDLSTSALELTVASLMPRLTCRLCEISTVPPGTSRHPNKGRAPKNFPS